MARFAAPVSMLALVVSLMAAEDGCPNGVCSPQGDEEAALLQHSAAHAAQIRSHGNATSSTEGCHPNQRCTNPRGPPCPTGSSCQHATGYCVCPSSTCWSYTSGRCECSQEHPEQRCTNPRGPPCPTGSSCQHATGWCVCPQDSCYDSSTGGCQSLAPPSPTPPSPPPAGRYTANPGYNCYPGAGASEVRTNTNVDGLPDRCFDYCTANSQCEGVVAVTGQTSGQCWEIKNINLDQCARNTQYTTYVSSLSPSPSPPSPSPPPTGRYTANPGYNCYAGAGASPVRTDQNVGNLPYTCFDYCTANSQCEGVVTVTGQTSGQCWEIKDIHLDQCLRNTPYTVYVQ